jgi:hypothetical protein
VETMLDRRSLARLGIEMADGFWDIEMILELYISDNPQSELIGLQDEIAELEGVVSDTPNVLVDRIRNLKIEVYANEHAPPHFHVKAPDVDACFRVSDGSLMYGKISNKQRDLVEEFFRDNRKRIVAFWNKTRPNGCPVGYVYEDPEGPGGIHGAKSIPIPKGKPDVKRGDSTRFGENKAPRP